MNIGFQISRESAKKLFFDRAGVTRFMNAAEVNYLRRAGGAVRLTARRSIRKRKGVSAAGTPPNSHTGVLRSGILFFLDQFKRSTVIGPVKTNQVFFNQHRQPVRGTVPQILEEGGEIKILEVFVGGRWRRADLRSKRRLDGLPTRLRTVRIAARPYMAPALAKNMTPSKTRQFWNEATNGVKAARAA